MIKVGSDFSGVGAFRQALMQLDIKHKTVFACDMDKYARQTYCANYGTEKDIELSKLPLSGFKSTDNVIKSDKVQDPKAFSFYFPTNVYNRDIPKQSLDIYMTSPPCQAFSLAGKRKGEADKRGILFYNSHEFIQKNKPRYFIFENVKGLLSDDKKTAKDDLGQTFTKWLTLLGGKSVNGNPVFFPHEDSVPYHIYWKVLNAKDYKVPQNRERVFIVGIRDDADNTFTWPKPYFLDKRLKDVLEAEVDNKYFLSDSAIKSIIQNENNLQKSKVDPEIANALQTPGNACGTYKGMNAISVTNFQGKDIANTIRSGGQGTFTDKHNWDTVRIGALRGRNPENPKSRKKGDNYEQTLEINKNGVSNTLSTVQKDNVVVTKNYIQWDQSGKGYKSQQDRAYFENGHMGCIPAGRTENKVNVLLSDYKIRRLTPRECFRLMGFPDCFKMPCSDTQMYKQAGNSIVVDVLAEIISKLKL